MKVDFIYDVATPNGYLAHKVIPEFEKRTNTTFNYIPCLAGGIFSPQIQSTDSACCALWLSCVIRSAFKLANRSSAPSPFRVISPAVSSACFRSSSPKLSTLSEVIFVSALRYYCRAHHLWEGMRASSRGWGGRHLQQQSSGQYAPRYAFSIRQWV